MKYFILLFFLLVSLAASAQETISETKEYVTYQDTLFILKTTTITNQGIEGVNDTLVDYAPPPLDTIGLINLLYTQANNSTNEKSARFRRAWDYKRINGDDSEYSSLLSALGADIDSMRVAAFSTRFKGRYRLVDDLGNIRFFDLIDHPALPTRLRLNEDGGADENINFKIDGSWSFTVRLNNENVSFEWTGEDRERPSFYKPIFWLPGELDNTRFTKIR